MAQKAFFFGGGGSSIPVLKEIQINMIDYIYNRISTAT